MKSRVATWTSLGHKLSTPDVIEECRRAAERQARRMRQAQWAAFTAQVATS